MIVVFLKWLYCMCCVLLRTLFPAQSTFPTALVVCHCCSGKALGQLLPLPRGLQCPSPVPLHSPTGGMSLLLKNWLWLQVCPFSCCFLCHKPILQELLRGECWSLFAASEEAACKRKAAFGEQPEPGAVGWGDHLWARCHLEGHDCSCRIFLNY